jgi:cell wall-associated NlpC family hydrolase
MNNSDLVNLLLPISTDYVFGGSRYEPYNTDCSGIVCAAFYQVFGIEPFVLGTWTGAQWSNGFLDFVWYGYSPDLPYDEMLPGDVIFTSNCSSDFSTGNGSHVGFYTGNPKSPFLSHFANGGPYVTAVNGIYGNERYYGVRRYTQGADEMNKDELISTRDSGNIPCWQAWSWAYTYSKDTAEAIKNLKVSGVAIDYDKLANKVADKLAERLKN